MCAHLWGRLWLPWAHCGASRASGCQAGETASLKGLEPLLASCLGLLAPLISNQVGEAHPHFVPKKEQLH